MFDVEGKDSKETSNQDLAMQVRSLMEFRNKLIINCLNTERIFFQTFILIKEVKEETGLDVLSTTSKQVRVALEKENKLADVPAQDQWRLPLLAKLLTERGSKFYLCENCDLLTEQIDSLCVN